MTAPRISTARLLPTALLVALMATVASCRGVHPVADNQPPLPADEPPAPVIAPGCEPRTLTVVNFTAVVEGTSVNGQMRMASDSVIWMSMTKIVELGRAMATPDSVWVSVPLAGKYFAGNYTDLERYTKRPVGFDALQQIAVADDAEAQIEALARQMGFEAKVRITRRQQVQRLTFPFTKQ